MQPARPEIDLDEYERRWREVQGRFEEYAIDALVVTSKTHIQYLTGHPAGGAYAAPYGLVIAPGAPRVFVVRAYDESTIRSESIPLELRTYFGRSDAVDVLADTLLSLGLQRARLGLELDCWGLAPKDSMRLQERLPDSRIVDASKLILAVAEVKSTIELAVMREAARVTDIAVGAFYDAIAEGVSEIEVADQVQSAVRNAGGALHEVFTLLLGSHTAMPHGVLADWRIRKGEVAVTELGAVHGGYVAGLVRTAALGDPSPPAAALYRLAEEMTETAICTLRPGAVAGEVDRKVRAVVERAGKGSAFRQRTGYGLGLGWYERGNISLEPGATDEIKEGMTFHMPHLLFDEHGRFGVGVSESVVVTPSGCEVLSRLPRELKVL